MSSEAQRFSSRGHDLSCRVCQHDRFHTRKAQLNTALMSLFDLDFLNRTATCAICERCGYIHWFARR